MKKHKFKVGDKVVFTNEGYIAVYGNPGIGIVEEVNDDGDNYQVHWPHSSCLSEWMYDRYTKYKDELELATLDDVINVLLSLPIGGQDD